MCENRMKANLARELKARAWSREKEDLNAEIVDITKWLAHAAQQGRYVGSLRKIFIQQCLILTEDVDHFNAHYATDEYMGPGSEKAKVLLKSAGDIMQQNPAERISA